MPKIEVNRELFFSHLKKSCNDDELEILLSAAKAELSEPMDKTIKIELNDTNRPDLWSAAGLARLLRIYEGSADHEYSFFSRADEIRDSGERRVKVEAGVKTIRPYIVAFVAEGKSVDEALLDEIIQMQEKLCWNFGQKRRAIAMGIYRSDLIEYPVHYRAVDPDQTRFVPLGLTESLSLREINVQHPKGQEFGHIVADFSLFPFLCDNNKKVLGYPPVINSASIGAVEVGDRELFIEMTGTDQQSLTLAASIVACNLADEGFSIQPVTVEYPFDTEFGREVTTPYYFQKPQSMELASINKLLGVELSAEEIQASLERMGNRVDYDKGTVTIQPPEYRNDFLHGVDLVEDVMIGQGMDTFTPELPGDFTIGRLSREEEFMRRVRNILVGLGFQEMIFNYLGSAMNYIYRMHPQYAGIQANLGENESPGDRISDNSIVQILNPMSENYEFLRNSILPGLLHAESVSANAAYPHAIFEVGKTACLDADEVYGTRSINTLGFLVADQEAGFNLLSSQISTLFYYIARDYELIEVEDQRFISGRAASILVRGKRAGVFGEIHPGILENWGIGMPAGACEIDMDILLET